MKSNHYPNIVCQRAPGPPPTVESRRRWLRWCRDVVNDMDAVQGTQIFGPSSAPGVAVELPTGFSDRKCTTLVLMIGFRRLRGS